MCLACHARGVGEFSRHAASVVTSHLYRATNNGILTALATISTTLRNEGLLVVEEGVDTVSALLTTSRAHRRVRADALNAPDGLATVRVAGPVVAVQRDGGGGESGGAAAALSVLGATTAAALLVEEGGTLVTAGHDEVEDEKGRVRLEKGCKR